MGFLEWFHGSFACVATLKTGGDIANPHVSLPKEFNGQLFLLITQPVYILYSTQRR